MTEQFDAIVVGGGLAGLVATAELALAGRRVALVEQEPDASLGGQAFWSSGGLFLVDSPEQQRLRIKNSHKALACASKRQRLAMRRGTARCGSAPQQTPVVGLTKAVGSSARGRIGTRGMSARGRG